MFKLSSIKVGMKYQNVRNEIIKSNNLVMSCLPAFCNSNYDVAENLDTKEKVYVSALIIIKQSTLKRHREIYLKFFIITDIDWRKFYGTNNKNFKCRSEFN